MEIINFDSGVLTLLMSLVLNVTPGCKWFTKKLNHWIMQFRTLIGFNSHHGIWAIIPCSQNLVTVCVCSKLKTSWKSVVFTNKVRKNSRYFVGVFNKTIIPFTLVGYEMIIANLALCASLAFYHLVSNAHLWNNC